MYSNQHDLVESIQVKMYNDEYFYQNILVEVVNEYAAEQIDDELAVRRLGIAAVCRSARTGWDIAEELMPQDALYEIGSWLWKQAKEDWGLE